MPATTARTRRACRPIHLTPTAPRLAPIRRTDSARIVGCSAVGVLTFDALLVVRVRDQQFLVGEVEAGLPGPRRPEPTTARFPSR